MTKAENGLVVEDMGQGILRLSEAALLPDEQSFFYLVAGTKLTCLIDGGWGLGAGLPEGLDQTADLIAVATHSHFDHIGHLHRIATRLGHPAEAPIFADPAPETTQAAPWLCGRPVLRDGGCIDPVALAQKPCPLTGHLTDGETLDLGGRALMVLHTPGHSPGSLSLLDTATKSLFCADVLLPGHIHDDIPGADPTLVRDSHRRIAALPFDRCLGGHGPAMDRTQALDRIARYAALRS